MWFWVLCVVLHFLQLAFVSAARNIFVLSAQRWLDCMASFCDCETCCEVSGVDNEDVDVTKFELGPPRDLHELVFPRSDTLYPSRLIIARVGLHVQAARIGLLPLVL